MDERKLRMRINLYKRIVNSEPQMRQVFMADDEIRSYVNKIRRTLESVNATPNSNNHNLYVRVRRFVNNGDRYNFSNAYFAHPQVNHRMKTIHKRIESVRAAYTGLVRSGIPRLLARKIVTNTFRN